MLLAGVLAVGVSEPAAAYIGPGAGLSLVGAFWGLVLAVGAALGFLLLWPIRRMFKRSRPQDADPASPETSARTVEDTELARQGSTEQVRGS